MSKAKFITGSTMKHIILMSLSGSIGIISFFLVDFLDLYFLSILGEKHIVAAVGFGSSLLFFCSSLSIGFSVTTSVFVAREVGASNFKRASRYFINITIFSLLLTILIAILIACNLDYLLVFFGAKKDTIQLAKQFLHVMIFSIPFMSTAIIFSAGIRSLGDATLAMHITLIGAATNAILDPVFIFVLGWGITGAALSSLLSIILMVLIGCYGIFYKHKLCTSFQVNQFLTDMKPIILLTLPVAATNLALPFTNVWLIKYFSAYGESAIAGFSIIGRLIPVAFGLVFALSGAVGPIIGQNYGAKKFDRIKSTYYNALLFSAVLISFVSFILFCLREYIPLIFHVTTEAEDLLIFFCQWISYSYIFVGFIFISSAMFNNLEKPLYASILNWSRATIGLIPFVYFFSNMSGVKGVLIGQAVGTILFGMIGVVASFWLLYQKEKQYYSLNH